MGARKKLQAQLLAPESGSPNRPFGDHLDNTKFKLYYIFVHTPHRLPRQSPRWDELFQLARPQQGYFTLGQAREAGYTPQALEYHLRKGRLERVGHGLYRLALYPPGDLEHLVPPWLWSERQGVYSHETALALHGLSDALPALMHLSVPVAWRTRRLRVPQIVLLHYQDVPPTERAWFGGVPATAPLRTLKDCLEDHVAPELLLQAAQEGLERGLFSTAMLRRELPEVLER